MQGVYREGLHGTSRFPLGLYHNQSGADGCLLYPHWHQDVEFFRLESGHARLVVDGEHHLLGPGAVACIPPGAIHGAWNHGNVRTRFLALVFDPAMLENPFLGPALAPFQDFLLGGSCLIESEPAGDGGSDATLSACLDRIMEADESDKPGRELRMMSALYALCAALPCPASLKNPGTTRKNQQGRDLRVLKTVVMHIQQEYHRPLGVEELAGLAVMSPNHFMRVFRKMTGTSAMDYLLQFRLEKAAFLLAGTSHSVKEIAHETGFSNPSHFIRRFRARYGMSPGTCRKQGNDTKPPGNIPLPPS